MNHEAVQSLESLNTSVEEGGGEEQEHHEAATQKELEMGALIPPDQKAEVASLSYNHGDEKHSSKWDEPSEVGDTKISAKPSLSQDGFHSETQRPATTSFISSRVDGVESHFLEILGEIEQMPTSTLASLPNNCEALRPAPFRRSKLDPDNMSCSDRTSASLVSQGRTQSGPGAYAVRMMRPHFANSSATASSAILDVAMVNDNEVRPNIPGANPILNPRNNNIVNLGSMVDLELSTSPASFLAEANPISEEPEDVTMIAASPVDLNEVRKRQLQWARQQKLFGLACFLLILAVIGGSVIGTQLTKGREEVAAQAPTAAISMEPSMAPSSAPTGVLDLLFLDLPLHTQDSIFNGTTPQNQAWEWLSTHQNITNLPDWRKKQLFALATFYFAFEGEHWNRLIQDRWIDDTLEECLWFSSGFGSFVDGEFVEWSLEVNGYPQTDSCNGQGEFTWLDLSGLQISGFAPSIPPEIALLTSLSNLGLYSNDIDAPFAAMFPTQLLLPTHPSVFMVSELGGLSSLRFFSTAWNNIPGPLSSELGTLTTIEVLYLEGNAFSGNIVTELGGMIALEELNLSYNSFSGTIPSELGRLTNLEWLELHNMPLLTGSIPSELSLLTSLLYLDLKNNTGLSGTIPDELCFLQNGSCTFLDYWGATYNCTLEFECTDMLCGCDCPCAK
jgi:Leucine-rich repeat (LRR) protein